MSWSSVGGAASLLPEPDELHAVPTVLRAVHGISLGPDGLYIFGAGLSDYVRMPFQPEGKTRVARFGEYTQSERLKVPETKYPGEWRGILFDQDSKRILWDATMLQMVQFVPEKEKIRVIQQTTVPVDMLRPPADRMGEPTAQETVKARAKFKSAYRKIFGLKYTGLTALPSGWMAGKKKNYLMSTRIEGFPLTVLGCDQQDSLTCTMERYCYLEGGPKIGAQDVSGVGVSPKGKIVLVGDAGRHQVHAYRWESCFNVRYIKSLSVPPMVQKLTSLQVDEADNLWLSTGKWENKFDSNLYYWEPSSWRNGLN